MTVRFYFAIGAAFRQADLAIALACGQRHFLVPAGTLAAERLRAVPDIHVMLDSQAYPPKNPRRISLAAYWRAVLGWRRALGDWGALDCFAAYDTIGDLTQTARDGRALQHLIDRDAPDAPLMPVAGYGMPIGTAVQAILAHPAPAVGQPSYGVGGLAVARYSAAAEAWYSALIDALDAADDAQLDGVRLHLFGIGKPSWVLRSTRGLVGSFDSSGPARLAGVKGWRGIARRYTPIYGVSVEKLQLSREARLYYHLASYRRSVGLPWNCLDEAQFVDDRTPPLGIQQALDLDTMAYSSYAAMPSASALPQP